MRRTDTQKAGIRKAGIKKAGALLLALAMLAGSLAGCARKEEPEEESRPREIVLTGVLAPKAEFQTVNYDLSSSSLMGDYVWWGDSLIWREHDWDVELQQGRSTWMVADMAGLKEAQPVAVEDEVRSIADLFTDCSGNLYFYGREYAKESFYLQKRDASGKEIYTVYPQVDAEYPNLYEGYADSEGNVVLVNGASEKAAIIDSEGNWKGNVKIEIPAHQVEFVDGGPDGVFLAMADTMEDEVQLQKISFEDGTLGRILTVKLPRQDSKYDLTDSHAVLLGGGSMGLLLSEKDALSYFDLQEGKGEKILDWNLLEINGTFVSQIRPGEKADEKPEFEVFLAGGNYDQRGFEPEIADISWVDEGYLPQKQTLIVGEGLGIGSLDLLVRRFNRSSENYRVEVEAFGYAQLENVAKGSGGSIPDIIDVHVIDMALLKDKQLLEDLGPWLEKSKVISRKGIADAAYEAGVMDGKLYSIVPIYSIVGLVTSGNAIGMEGFTMGDFAAKAAENPDARVIAPSNPNYLLMQTLPGMMDRFVDWKKGKCKFDGKEFSEFLSQLKSLNLDLQNTGDKTGAFASGVLWGTVLYDMYYCSGPGDFYSNITQKKDRVEMIGFPTRDGKAFYTVYPQQQYAMYAKGNCKEGAWEFLEFLLSEEQQSWGERSYGIRSHFPANRSALERYLTRSASEEEDEGMKEAREAVRYMLEHAHPNQMYGRNREIYYIIYDELEAFLRGDKSLEDTAGIIQSRASLYVAECM